MSIQPLWLMIQVLTLFHVFAETHQCIAYDSTGLISVESKTDKPKDCLDLSLRTPKCVYFTWISTKCTLRVGTRLTDASTTGVTLSSTICDEYTNCSSYTDIVFSDPIAITNQECAQRSVAQPDAMGYDYRNGICLLEFVNGERVVATDSPGMLQGYVLCSPTAPTTTQAPTTVTTTQPPTTEATTQPPTTVEAAATTRRPRKQCKKGKRKLRRAVTSRNGH
ncbi:uncharacterized protein LOC131952475 [Physella acuta]|uniref:uncharacterized protein LOC131952475 n=1 Tax=Physella acuta TaxID=109671 RepID=UPI0027DD35E8|nr:uncharacterized protein LOC131952475 [Physella acuta]